ncbi:ABC transporter ATP-binding protein [Allomuricauda sp. SCSIO 65647]|uniref:ABC transporter ATP-binding protein n=1 Tax=Allomuricauda sp. SCSIO 65647 TaxID=2908843 RepID=UPI001F4496C6|nr:ATP-binding cassette domain-containing protein [Muricauda sp. SCSIO 65647]UJH66780.1 ATP-binding cassette domain-containing protein [Muricauda sp. SCSIO 65647]
MDHILVADSVTKNYGGHRALSQISLKIPENSIYGLLGPNGAGKTSLIRIINQITHPDSGTVFFNGEKLAPHHIAMIGYLPEERGLYKSMKVGEQALYLAQLKGLPKTEAKKRLKYWFDRLEIGDWWNRKIQELSKGMAQKVQFIVTVLHEPKLLIFDEPFSGFDPINANAIKDEILRLRQQGASIIFSTHRMESVEELCEYIALIHQSEKILDGKLADIKNAHKKNIFQVSLKTAESYREKLADLNGKFELTKDEYNPLEGQLNITVQLPTDDTSILLGELSTWGNIVHFEETIPTANDIFIQTVKAKDQWAS